MSNTILIIGESGTGKSTSIRNLNPNETFIINVIDKPLPFRGFKSKYNSGSGEEKKMNYFSTKDPDKITQLIRRISSNRDDIKNIVIDDFQYIMANHSVVHGLKKGFDKFTEIAIFVWNIVNELQNCRGDINCYILSHSDMRDDGTYKPKTVGKMIDNQICLEGMFTIVLHSVFINGSYKFLTQNDGVHMAKSPMGLFNDKLIDNDLNEINKLIDQYFNEDINQ